MHVWMAIGACVRAHACGEVETGALLSNTNLKLDYKSWELFACFILGQYIVSRISTKSARINKAFQSGGSWCS